MNKVIYIAGPYTGISLKQQAQHIEAAEQAAQFVWTNGGIAICPHLNTRAFASVAFYKHFAHGYCEVLTRCDAIWLIKDWENSRGARAEHYLATYLDLIILQTTTQALDYIKEAKKCPMQKTYTLEKQL